MIDLHLNLDLECQWQVDRMVIHCWISKKSNWRTSNLLLQFRSLTNLPRPQLRHRALFPLNNPEAEHSVMTTIVNLINEIGSHFQPHPILNSLHVRSHKTIYRTFPQVCSLHHCWINMKITITSILCLFLAVLVAKPYAAQDEDHSTLCGLKSRFLLAFDRNLERPGLYYGGGIPMDVGLLTPVPSSAARESGSLYVPS